MPVRHWATLPEATAIHALLADATYHPAAIPRGGDKQPALYQALVEDLMQAKPYA